MPAPDVNAMRQKFFQARRDDVDRNTRGQQQETDDALQRRFTALGQGGSGAAIGAQLKAREGLQAQRNAAMGDVDAQEAGAQMQSAEAQLGRDFQRSFGLEMADKDMGFKRQLFDIEQGNKLKEIDLAERQFALDRDTTEFNKRMAEIEAGRKPPGMLDGLGIPGVSNPMDIVTKQALPGGLPNPVKAITNPVAAVTGGGK